MSQSQNTVPSKVTTDQLTAAEFNNVAEVQNLNATDSESRLTTNETDINTNQSAIDNLESVTGAPITGHSDKIAALESDKVDNTRVLTDVPAGAIFTDTIYDDTAIQLEVDANTAKTGITAQQASDITANNAKVSDVNHVTAELPNVDNTSDSAKPISTLTQAALDDKANSTQVLTDVPAGAVFTDTVYDDTTIQAALDDKVDDTDPRLTDARTPTAHTHTLTDITDAGTAAGSNTGDFATAAQGSTADSAVQSVVAGSNITVDATDPNNPVVNVTNAPIEIADTAALYALTGLVGGERYKTLDTKHEYEYLGGGESTPSNWLDHSAQDTTQPLNLTLIGDPTNNVKAYALDAIPNAWSGTIGTDNNSLHIGSSVTSIGSYGFAYSTGFTGDLTIPDSVTTISDFAFNGCSGFTGNLTIGNSVTTIDSSAFTSCIGFTGSLTIPDSVTTIGTFAFYNCTGFTGNLTIGNSVTSIGSSAFQNCSGLTGSLTIPDLVTSIGSSAFYFCFGLTGNLTIPDSVTSIGSYAFYNCSGLTNVNCHVTRTIMDATNALLGCSALTTLHAEAGKGWTAGADTIGGKALTVIIDL